MAAPEHGASSRVREGVRKRVNHNRFKMAVQPCLAVHRLSHITSTLLSTKKRLRKVQNGGQDADGWSLEQLEQHAQRLQCQRELASMAVDAVLATQTHESDPLELWRVELMQLGALDTTDDKTKQWLLPNEAPDCLAFHPKACYADVAPAAAPGSCVPDSLHFSSRRRGFVVRISM